MTSIALSSLSGLNVNLLPQVIIDKLADIDPSQDKRFLPWLKKSFVQKPFDLKPDFTLVVNAVLRYAMSLPKKHSVELPDRTQLETWLVQMQWLEQKKYKGLPALQIMQPKGMNEIPLSIRNLIEQDDTWTKKLIKELHYGTCYVITVEPKRWIVVLLKQQALLNASLQAIDPQAFMEQWSEDLAKRNKELADNITQALPLFIEKYVHGLYNFAEMEMYYDDFLNGHTLDYLAQDQNIVVHYFHSLQKRKVKHRINKVA